MRLRTSAVSLCRVCESTESERDLLIRLIFEVRNLERMLVCTSGGGAQVRRRGLVATGRR